MRSWYPTPQECAWLVRRQADQGPITHWWHWASWHSLCSSSGGHSAPPRLGVTTTCRRRRRNPVQSGTSQDQTHPHSAMHSDTGEQLEHTWNTRLSCTVTLTNSLHQHFLSFHSPQWPSVQTVLTWGGGRRGGGAVRRGTDAPGGPGPHLTIPLAAHLTPVQWR